MERYRNINALVLFLLSSTLFFTACTKYGTGFLSPNIQYASNQFTVVRGRVAASYSLTTDGSSIPLSVKWKHVYDSTGKMVDTLFKKMYPVPVWTAAYNPLTDTNYTTIITKRSVQNMQPITVNETSGTIQSNSGTIYLPLGTYTMDLEVTNAAGSEALKKVIQIVLIDGKSIETAPETGNYSVSRLKANTSGGATNSTISAFNNVNNPFVLETITRVSDTPNVVIMRFTDKNGVVFNPKNEEVAKRPKSGVNPVLPFLQNLQDYAPDTFQVLDTALFLKYPLVPFPISTLGNGFNMYYRIPTAFVSIDSTTVWSNNASGYYQGANDSHYKGTLKNDLYDYSIRIPLRIQVPGSYLINLKLLNTTHR